MLILFVKNIHIKRIIVVPMVIPINIIEMLRLTIIYSFYVFLKKSTRIVLSKFKQIHTITSVCFPYPADQRIIQIFKTGNGWFLCFLCFYLFRQND
ncbi:hypothetical protein D3C75_662740 [compost metagenome]